MASRAASVHARQMTHDFRLEWWNIGISGNGLVVAAQACGSKGVLGVPSSGLADHRDIER